MNKYNYVITIKEPDYRTANVVTFLMLLLAVAFFGYIAARYWNSNVYHNAAILYVVIAVFIPLWSLYSFFSARRNGDIAFYRMALLAAAIGWFTEPVSNYWMAGLFALAALLERQVKFPQEMGVDDTGITFNSLPSKEYSWDEIKNLLLKDGMLTVDYKNNKLYQHEIASEVNPALEREFNQYCQKRLAAVS